MEQNGAIKVHDPKVKREILSPTKGVLDESKLSEEKYQRVCEVRDEYKFRYLHFKQLYEKVLEEKEDLLKESAIPQTEMWALKAQVESLQDELKGYKSKVEEYKILLDNSCTEKEEIIRKSLEKVEQRALEAQVASLQDELQAYAECKSKLLQQDDLYKKVLMENELLKTNSNEFRALELQVASLQDELTNSKNQYAELNKRYAEKEKQFSDLEVKRCAACRASCISIERQRVKNELAEGSMQEGIVLEEFQKKQNELQVQLESQTKALESSQEECRRLETKVMEVHVELDTLREKVDELTKENPGLKPIEFREKVDELTKENPGLEPFEFREKVDELTKENSGLKPIEMEMLKGDHSTKKPVVHKIISKKEECKGKRFIRKRKTTDNVVDAQDVKMPELQAPPSPLCETGSKKERNLRKRGRNQSNKVAELAEDMKTLNLKPEKIEKTKRVPRPRKKKVQDENDPAQDVNLLQLEEKISRNTRSQRKKTTRAVESVDTSAASAATRSQRV